MLTQLQPPVAIEHKFYQTLVSRGPNIDITCHKSLLPESINHFIAVHSALKLCGHII